MRWDCEDKKDPQPVRVLPYSPIIERCKRKSGGNFFSPMPTYHHGFSICYGPVKCYTSWVADESLPGKETGAACETFKEHNVIRRFFSESPVHLACGLAILIVAACLASVSLPGTALAQAESQPLNLGEVIQNSTEGARAPRTYLKLPETIPVPEAKPAIGEGAEQGTGDAAEATAKTAEGTSEEGAETNDAAGVETSVPEVLAAPTIEPGGVATLRLEALLSDDGQILQRGINWRIFGENPDENGQLVLLENIDGGIAEVDLDPGSYVVYCGYGYANLTKRIVLERAGTYSESFNLRAGALRLNAVAAGDIPLDDNILSFNIYSRDATGDTPQELVVENVRPEHVVKLTEGTYHVISSYGSSNAKVRGDVEVQAGRLINVTMIHNAAKVTLRLVSEPGGEALTNTVWTVLTPGGDIVKQAIGAFPTLALTAGEYTAIAKQNDEVYNREFSVDSGLDRDIEVLATQQQ